MRRFLVVGIGVVVVAPALVACTLLNSLDYLDSELDDAASGDASGDVASATPDGSGEAGVPDAEVDAGQSYAALVREDKPFFYLRLSESSGPLAADSSNNGHDGAYIGGVLRGQPGAIANDTDHAVMFDGTAEQYINMQQATGRQPNDAFTIEAWIWPKTPSQTPFDVVADDNGAVMLFSQNGQLKFERSDTVSETNTAPFQPLSYDRYSHVVGTYDGDGGTMRLYVDGLDVYDRASTLGTGPATQPMKIGVHFPGSIDEVAYYDHALSPERVRAHHDRGVGLPQDH